MAASAFAGTAAAASSAVAAFSSGPRFDTPMDSGWKCSFQNVSKNTILSKSGIYIGTYNETEMHDLWIGLSNAYG